MYSDGEAHDAPQTQRKIPPASSMLWVRNLRRFIGSGAGLGSEALMGSFPFLSIFFSFVISINYYFITYIIIMLCHFAELETKRILLDIFKDKQKKSAEAGTIPSFYKKACQTINFIIIIIIIMHV